MGSAMSKHADPSPQRRVSRALVALGVVFLTALGVTIATLATGSGQMRALVRPSAGVSAPVSASATPFEVLGANGSHRTHPTRPPTLPGGPDPVPVMMDQPMHYTVHVGDTLTAIASQYHLKGYASLYVTNRRVIGADANLIRPGTVLVIPRT